MKIVREPVAVLAIVALAWAGCDDEASRSDSAPVAAAKGPTRIIEIPETTLHFEPTRDDITVGKVVFSVYSSAPETLLVDGSSPEPRQVAKDPPETYIYKFPPSVSENLFELPSLTIAFEEGDHVCISVKAFFDEVPNRYDSMYYQDLDDRYALVSYCTTDSEAGSARFSQNRVAALDEFLQAISRPVVIHLNQRPLPDS